MELSKNFTLNELCKSQTAERKGISNNPSADDIFNLRALAEKILQPIRNEYGSYVISSGYRCPELSIAIGSSSSSNVGIPSGEKTGSLAGIFSLGKSLVATCSTRCW